MKLKRMKRSIAFREFGDPLGSTILLCIPGILETQNSFDQLVTYVEHHQGCRLITVDLCGRGNSDWLKKDESYKMSVYLDDLRQLITHLHATHKRQIRKLYLLGTSMGGILAMNLASDRLLRVKGLILNDVALSISWQGLYKLFGKFDSGTSTAKIKKLSKANKIDPQLLADIKMPRHIDIGYRFNLRGINFHKSISNFDGPILLLRGENSDLCSLIDQIELNQTVKNSRSVEVEGEAHPVSYKPEVLLEIANFLGLEKVSQSLCADSFETDYHKLEKNKKLVLT
jgi:pimeloyl-ACP methyl ester carboxylesterase